MKDSLKALLKQAFENLQQQGVLDESLKVDIQLERTRDESHGDFACNLAMMLAKPARRNPRELAQMLVDNLPADALIEKVEIAGPGFINFSLAKRASFQIINDILAAGDNFGRSDEGAGKKIQVEFVSANPTGPLHVGHGRGAAYGATVADLLEAVGFDVTREYYVNDAGRQMDILGTSVWLRYLELGGEDYEFPSNGYLGDYVQDIAATLRRENDNDFHHAAEVVFENIPADEPAGGDKEEHIDALINRAKELLGKEGYNKVFELGLNVILDDIRNDLGLFGVNMDNWFRERSLMDSGAIDKALQKLQDSGHVYEEKGALWFKSTDFGDEKDRVVVRENGQSTYFASDIAYHMDKFDRGFDQVIDVWGADHHGYIPRVRASLDAIGYKDSDLKVLLVQFANLYRGGEKVAMSTRSGQFVTLRQLRKEVGTDAARYFYVMRKCEQHMDFDLDLAKSQSSENPVYYVQYAHARVCSVFNQMSDKGLSYDQEIGLANLNRLTESHEDKLLKNLQRYTETLNKAALSHEPHQIVHYLRELANDFHAYYNAHQFLVDDAELRNARLVLISVARQVIKNALLLLGVSAPESM